ncbi:MAG: IclR family transcriptional regulator, partial [Hyphomicrobiales bacterium]|nr:IclR family transcriptional regulator [Hyphomicrobiales bacterium]
ILLAENLIELDPRDKKYRLGPRIMNWAASAWHRTDIQQAAADELDQLAQSCGHNVALAIPADKAVLILRSIENYQIRYVPKVGDRAPVHCTALGKAIAAFQPAAQRSKLIDDIELEKFTENTITDKQLFAAELRQVIDDGYASCDGEEFLKVCGVASPVFDFQGSVAGSVCIWSQIDKAGLTVLEEMAPQLMRVTGQISKNLGYQSR